LSFVDILHDILKNGSIYSVAIPCLVKCMLLNRFLNLPCSSALTVLDIIPRKTGVIVPANMPATGADYNKQGKRNETKRKL